MANYFRIYDFLEQEIKLLVSSCDGISSCVFLKDGSLATTSFDGHIEVWDLENGCRWNGGCKREMSSFNHLDSLCDSIKASHFMSLQNTYDRWPHKCNYCKWPHCRYEASCHSVSGLHSKSWSHTKNTFIFFHNLDPPFPLPISHVIKASLILVLGVVSN